MTNTALNLRARGTNSLSNSSWRKSVEDRISIRLAGHGAQCHSFAVNNGPLRRIVGLLLALIFMVGAQPGFGRMHMAEGGYNVVCGSSAGVPCNADDCGKMKMTGPACAQMCMPIVAVLPDIVNQPSGSVQQAPILASLAFFTSRSIEPASPPPKA